jgi:hypothetical protein
MVRYYSVLALITLLTYDGIAKAQESYPITEKSQPPSGEKAEMEQRVVTLLQNDPQMRTAFINLVAAPIANKLFECGMIP